MRKRAGRLKWLASGVDWSVTMAMCLAFAMAGFMLGYQHCLRRLCDQRDAVIIHVEEANYNFAGRTVIELSDGRLLERPGVWGEKGQHIKARPQLRGGWK